MAVASCIPSFKTALVTRLAAAVDSAVTVSYGISAAVAAERDLVHVGNAKGVQSTVSMGRKRREEKWVQEIVVSCVRSSRETQQLATERAFEIAGDVEDSLRTWLTTTPSFSGYSPPTGADFISALVIGTDLDESVDEKEREGRVTIRVDCTART